MIPTATILEALKAYVTSLGLFDRVEAHDAADLSDAIESLRDPAAKVCFLIPGRDSLEHQIMEENIPMHSELRSQVQVLISSQDASYTHGGEETTLPLKDHLLALLMWEDLGQPGLLTLPTSCEPLRVEWDDAPARSAWQLDLECRQTLTPSL